MKIVLIGYMGSGKSSVGKKLAAVLGFTFKDLDSIIENQESCSITEIFSKKGEIYFRKIENEILKTTLSVPGNLILATGGGTPCYADSMSFMTETKDVVTLYLKTPLDVLSTRLFNEKLKRPLLVHLKREEELNDFIRKHLFERAFYYNQANVIIDNGSGNIADTVEKIILKLF
ncbi:shikimate kinase [Aequorivita sp. CIP111184]|uniref:shikimate kinase n=1 Tax=Aequorivita sp. CIP111184 TaxID=2211356 RepID=UPI000DBBF09D|nr:shikimate kinase [Aequorivita sp. CIP111184]SRX55561.1 Shikimate kinase [Aequorivita sp. CIP111184]